MLKKKLIFNELGDDSLDNRTLLGGNTTNLINLNSLKYKQFLKLYDTMAGNIWFPQKVDLSGDNWGDLTKDEQVTFKGVLSFLIFLDSIQVNMIMGFNDYCTIPEASMVFSIWDFSETIHTRSYQTIIETVIPIDERDGIYEFWREDPILLERNKVIASLYQEFRDNPTEQTFKEALTASLIVESVFFYNAFCFFYSLATRNKMQGCAEMISLISRDELTHCVFGVELLKLVCDFSDKKDANLIYRLFEEGCKTEIAWSNHILGDDILGISSSTTEAYTKHLVNRRLRHLGLKPLYDNVENPYRHLEQYADLSGRGEKRSNFFEANTVSYVMENAIKGWDF